MSVVEKKEVRNRKKRMGGHGDREMGRKAENKATMV